MRPGAFVVAHVLVQDPLEVPRPEEQQPVQAVTPRRAHPALRERVRAGRPHRRPNDADALGGEDAVEGGRELCVPVAEERRGPDPCLAQVWNYFGFVDTLALGDNNILSAVAGALVVGGAQIAEGRVAAARVVPGFRVLEDG